MDNMKLLQYAANAAIDEMIRYQRFAIKFAGQKSGVIAEKKSKEIVDDLNEIKTMIQDEKRKQMAKAEEEAKCREEERAKAETEQRRKQAPYVIILKWDSPMGEKEYPCKNMDEAKENFDRALHEFFTGNVTSVRVYEQRDGKREIIMGIGFDGISVM